MSKVIAEPNINLGKGQVLFFFLISFISHFVLLYRAEIPLETFSVGMGMLVIYYQYMRDFPTFSLSLPIVLITFGALPSIRFFIIDNGR